ncbi:cytochrome-c peroxidase [Zeimonas arvi]|uniref:C-type cytochrome n=1 Tax=Zeimonas arvi TaxID=2498847 RepID=A0A5C8P5Q4_9BURK|nr:cytochrome c peroxidase [Zeimonas arvi]TXL68434.1 c-type cytochrome [Zeimonas arvi]
MPRRAVPALPALPAVPAGLARLQAGLARLLVALAPLLPAHAQADGGIAAGFTEAEIATILSHGPWPPEPRRDPTNRLSGDPDAIALGRELFFDPGLSRDGRISCASCHDPAKGFTDGLPRGQGLARHDRNTQALLDLSLQRWFGWDGGADSLWAASIRPMLSPIEMGADAASAAARLGERPELAGRLASWPPHEAPASDEARLVYAGKAIAAWLETLVSPRTPFDEFRDALARGDEAAMRAYPAPALRGLKLFTGRGNCSVCHAGPAFSNGEFHDIGRPFLVERGRIDPGRHAGIRRLKTDPYNLTGRWNDQPPAGGSADASLRTRTVALQHRNWGEWKTPTLRGLPATGPYTHDGSLATLRDMVRHYSELDLDRLHADGEALLKPLKLSDAQIDDLVAFLESLGAPVGRTAAAKAGDEQGQEKKE